MLKTRIDEEVVLELMELASETDPGMLDQLVKNFSFSASGILQDIQIQLEKNDLEKVVFVAHKLKGSAGLLGLLPLAAKANELMLAARPQASAETSLDCERIYRELEDLLRDSLFDLHVFISKHRH